MVSTSSKRDSMFRALHFVILMTLLFLVVVSGDSQWLQSCGRCRCHWNSGRKAADCSNISLTAIPNNFSSELQNVDFSFNSIAELQDNQFTESNLPNMQKLFLRHCTMLEVHRTAFVGLKVLIELDLSFNQIRVLHPDTFNDIDKLRKLIFNNNELVVLPPRLFMNLKYLSVIEFEHNRLTTIGPNTFFNLKAMAVINLGFNRMKVLKPETFERIGSNLTALYLKENLWNCTCQLAAFREYVIKKNVYSNPTECHDPPQLAGKSWKDIPSEHFACRPQIVQPVKRTHGGPSGFYVEATSENMTLTCRIRAAPMPNIFWIYNKRPINLSDRRVLVVNANEANSDEDLGTYTSELTIFGVRPNDKGSYVCQAENHGGSDELEFQLAVVARGLRAGMEDSPSNLFLITCIVAIVLLILLIAVILALCLYCRRVRRYNKDTSISENGLMTSKMDKTQNGSMLEGSVITEMQKSLLTEVNPVEKPPRRTTDIESLDMDDGHDIKKTLLDETPFGSHDEETNSIALSDTTPRSRQTFVDDGYGTNLPPDLLSFQARVPQSPSLQSSMSNIPDSRLYGKSPLASPVYQHVINHPTSTPNNGIYGVNPAAFRTLQHPKNRNLALGVTSTRSNNSSPFIPAPIVYPPVVMKQGYMTIPRKPRVPSWTPSCSTTLSEFQPTNTTTGSISGEYVEPVYDNLGLRTTAGGNSSLNLTKIGSSAAAAGQQQNQSPAIRYTMKDRPLPATPSLNTSANGAPNQSLIYEPIQEMANLTTMTSDTEPLYGTAKNGGGHGVIIVRSGASIGSGTLDKMAKIPPRPPPKPKKKISVTSNGQGSTSQLFEDEGEDGTEV